MASKEVLTGISYYQYHFFAALTFSVYSAYHYFYGNRFISFTLGATALLNMGLIICRALGKDSALIQKGILLAIISAVFSACYFLGLRGAFWLFPLVIGVFFTYSIRNSLIVSTISVFGGLILATHLIDTILAIRMFFPLALTIGFAYLYRVSIEKEQNALEKQANEDYLTGISNRRSFQNWLQRTMLMHRKENRLLAVIYMDIDDFKHINDTYGHEFGDKVIKEVSNRIVNSIRPTDAASYAQEQQTSRIAGDEFVVAIGNLGLEQDADIVAKRLLESLNNLLVLDKVELNLSLSIGVALNKNRDVTAENLLSEADAAMYRSKELGKNRITYFDEQIANVIIEKQNIARGIEEALRNQAFFLNFMPIFKLDDEKTPYLAGAEVLIRCQSDVLSVGPDKYIPIAEEYGSIKAIDLHVIELTFQTISEMQHKLPDDFILAINISAKELHNDEFPQKLEALALQYAIPRNLIELEITETSLVAHDDESIAMLKTIKALGFNLSLDDFGTGYTAFSQLQKYPVDTLKIDRSFVWDISEQNQEKQTMVDVILSLANLYEVKVVAEGVENQVQLNYLSKANCHYFQGFYLSKPLPWAQFKDDFLSNLNSG